MCHRFVEVMFGERLRVIHGEGRDQRNDHLANMRVSVCLELHYLLCGILHVVSHKLN